MNKENTILRAETLLSKDIRARIEQYRIGLNLTQVAFAKTLGVSTPAYNEYIVHGKTIGKIVLNLIVKYPDLNTEWLFRGYGNMSSVEEEASIGRIAIQEKDAMDSSYMYRAHACDEELKALREELAQRDRRIIDLERKNAVLEYQLNQQKP